jgi:hypothetical protein
MRESGLCVRRTDAGSLLGWLLSRAKIRMPIPIYLPMVKSSFFVPIDLRKKMVFSQETVISGWPKEKGQGGAGDIYRIITHWDSICILASGKKTAPGQKLKNWEKRSMCKKQQYQKSPRTGNICFLKEVVISTGWMQKLSMN